MNLPPIELDPRFAAAIDQFNRREFLEASEVFEDLFFEAAGDELEFARVFLQMSTGFVHAERGQRRPAIERLGEGLLAIARVSSSRNIDLSALREDVEAAIACLRAGKSIDWPMIRRT